MTQASLRQFFTVNKAAVLGFFFIAGVVLVSIPSCKSGQGSCDAYQGSTRSHKKKRAEVVRELPQSIKLS
ncbi:MAG: hypothetical protein MUC87_16085 [Bacteroidia bacterium]|nr:hypothetical protein [Bacteroidia bacterium]